MTALTQLSLTLCYICAAVSIISLFLPQKRTRKIFGFVIGLFVIASLITCIGGTKIALEDVDLSGVELPDTDTEEFNAEVIRQTADNMVDATDELLRAEGIEAKDIRLSLKISDEGRIYAQDVFIYISEDDLPRKREVENIVYANLKKEPRVYVEKEEVE